MKKITLSAVIFLLSFKFFVLSQSENIYQGIADTDEPSLQNPPVMVAILVRNKAHILPSFLKYLENLHYPKDRIGLWIRSDHNRDNSVEIVKEWLKHVGDQYHWVDFKSNESETDYPNQKTTCHWTEERFQHVMILRQEALETARDKWVDFLFMVDADCLMENDMVLSSLIKQDKTVVAPLLNTTASKYYSNFWGGMKESGYYVRTDRYMPILKREVKGCHIVPMVHSAILINLRHRSSLLLAYYPPPLGYNGPKDDIIQFAWSAKVAGVSLHILNEDYYGLMLVPMEEHNTLEQEQEQFIHMKLESIVLDRPLRRLTYIEMQMPVPNTIGFDQIYMINLKRRPDRREKMVACFAELGIKAKLVDAVDGRELTSDYLDQLGIKMLPGYADPYHKRAVTMGEIGCFLSHYFIWKDVVANSYDRVLVFEDDIRFQVYFESKLKLLMQEVNGRDIDWDLIYVGRKKLRYQDEVWLDGSEMLVYPEYSYWTLSYLLSQRGAQKLLAQQPLTKMIPVDEYIPIMFDKHPEYDWKNAFHPRDMVALSAEPLLVEPTHYTGEPGYITDTEESVVIEEPLSVDGLGDSHLNFARGDMGMTGTTDTREEL